MKSLVPSLEIIFLKQSISSSTGLDWVNSRKSENIFSDRSHGLELPAKGRGSCCGSWKIAAQKGRKSYP